LHLTQRITVPGIIIAAGFFLFLLLVNFTEQSISSSTMIDLFVVCINSCRKSPLVRTYSHQPNGNPWSGMAPIGLEHRHKSSSTYKLTAAIPGKCT
jgi:hypothetical protein